MENFFNVEINTEHLYLLGKQISHLTKLRKAIAQKMKHASREESGELLSQSKEIILHRAALRLEKTRLLKSLEERERHEVEVAVRCRHIENDRRLALSRRREKQAKKRKQSAERFTHKIAWLKNALGERYERIIPKAYQETFEKIERNTFQKTAMDVGHLRHFPGQMQVFAAKQWLNRVYRRLKNTPHLVAYRIWNKSLHFLDLHYGDYNNHLLQIKSMFVKQGNPESCPDYPKFEEFGLKE